MVELVRTSRPTVELKQVDHEPVKMKNGTTAIGFYPDDPEDERYWEQVTSKDGNVQWFELVDNDYAEIDDA